MGERKEKNNPLAFLSIEQWFKSLDIVYLLYRLRWFGFYYMYEIKSNMGVLKPYAAY
jgi:hypothetical protein